MYAIHILTIEIQFFVTGVWNHSYLGTSRRLCIKFGYITKMAYLLPVFFPDEWTASRVDYSCSVGSKCSEKV